jgi:hypothetical protein
MTVVLSLIYANKRKGRRLKAELRLVKTPKLASIDQLAWVECSVLLSAKIVCYLCEIRSNWRFCNATAKLGPDCTIPPTLPFIRSCQRSGRSPALPYPLHEFLYFTTLSGGLFSLLKWAHFQY